MARVTREIIRIDEDKCDGCGACVPGCKEGALQIVDGKAKLVSEVYCDGLGACLGTCPKGAITIERREAELFDEEAVNKMKAEVTAEKKGKLACGCPGTHARSIAPAKTAVGAGVDLISQLGHWPIQLALVPANAPYLKDADLLLLADCTAVAYANLHRDFIAGKVVAMACPKLEDVSKNVDKLARVIEEGRPRSIEVVMMEVPCCEGLYGIAKEAVRQANANIEIKSCVISVEGEVIERN